MLLLLISPSTCDAVVQFGNLDEQLPEIFFQGFPGTLCKIIMSENEADFVSGLYFPSVSPAFWAFSSLAWSCCRIRGSGWRQHHATESVTVSAKSFIISWATPGEIHQERKFENLYWRENRELNLSLGFFGYYFFRSDFMTVCTMSESRLWAEPLNRQETHGCTSITGMGSGKAARGRIKCTGAHFEERHETSKCIFMNIHWPHSCLSGTPQH